MTELESRLLVERQAIRKVTWRILPLLMASYLVCYIDRLNVGFAAITANADLGLSPAAFGWGAGILFVGYCAFEVPSNLALQRFGARLWLSRIMITWGLISAAMALVVGPMSFYAMRFLLGAAEAGFLPGVLLYLSYWVPRRYRGRYIGVFALGIPLSGVIGAPMSGALLGLDGVWGLKGWQWLYIVEGAPAVVLGLLTALLLSDRPAKARWLAPPERDWLEAELAAELAEREPAPAAVRRLFLDPRVLGLSAIYFGTAVPSYGLNLWLPQIVKSFGLTNWQTGLVTALPYLFGCVAMVLWGRRSDREGERVWHVASCMLLAGVALCLCLAAKDLPLQMALVCLAAVGVFGMKGPFLALISEAFSPRIAAAGIAVVSSLGNLSGWLAPYGVGLIKTYSGGYGWSLVALGLASILTGFAIIPLRRAQTIDL